MRILVTGGGGFLGRTIVGQLLSRGDTVSIIARSNYPELESLGVTCFRGDLADLNASLPAFESQDAVIHTAAKAGVWGTRADYVASNVTATQNVVDACVTMGVSKLVFTSSPSVTFDGADVRKGSRNIPYPKDFLAFYPQTKALAEQIVLAANSPLLRATSLRPHLIWGPRDPHLIPRLVDAARSGRLKIVGDGTNQVDLTYVDNAAVAHLQALDALDRVNGPAGKAFFISDDNPVVLWNWINTLLVELGIPPVTSHVSPRMAYLAGGVLEGIHRLFSLPQEPRMTRFVAQQLATSHWYDMEPAKTDFNYTPIMDPDTGFANLLEYLKIIH